MCYRASGMWKSIVSVKVDLRSVFASGLLMVRGFAFRMICGMMSLL